MSHTVPPVLRRPCIVPPYVLEHLAEHGPDPEVREAARRSLLSSIAVRAHRVAVASLAGVSSSPTNGRRSIFDFQHRTRLSSAVLVRTEDGPASGDQAVNRAFEGLGVTRDFYQQVLQRNSIDGKGMRMNGYVHRGRKFNNAFWDGREMQFGDGDGVLFTDFTGSLDVIAHELTHGVTQFTANLDYENQSGALNESISDVFGSVVKQWKLGQTAEQADWLIGADIFTPAVGGDALRSMKAPGTAYDNPQLGKDPQPDHMSRFVHLPNTPEDDNGGVHINSGIPNKAFYLVASSIGGNAWEAPAHIWYESLEASVNTTDFQRFADTTYVTAGRLYGTGGPQQKAVVAAWDGVGITVTQS
ncbi:MAG TPA: M4 family metallopeptidase [Kineosporiaceae bacterium]